MVKKTNIENNQTPEELAALIAELEEKRNKAVSDMKAARQKSVSDAVGKAGADFELKFGEYLTRQKQVEEARKSLAENVKFLNDKYKEIRDQLVAAGAKEEYLGDVIGQPPSAGKVKAAGTGTGTKAKRTHVVYPDGTSHTWVDFCLAQGYTKDQLEGNSAKRVYLGKNQTLPSGYSEVEVN